MRMTSFWSATAVCVLDAENVVTLKVSPLTLPVRRTLLPLACAVASEAPRLLTASMMRSRSSACVAEPSVVTE